MKKVFVLILAVMFFAACENKAVQQEQQPVPAITLTGETTRNLDAIFSYSTGRLNNIAPNEVVVIRTQEELEKICPSRISAPSIDFHNECLIFTRVETASISDEWTEIQLYKTAKIGTFDLHVRMKACTECYAAIGHHYPYGVFMIAPDEISKINLSVQYEK